MISSPRLGCRAPARMARHTYHETTGTDRQSGWIARSGMKVERSHAADGFRKTSCPIGFGALGGPVGLALPVRLVEELGRNRPQLARDVGFIAIVRRLQEFDALMSEKCRPSRRRRRGVGGWSWSGLLGCLAPAPGGRHAAQKAVRPVDVLVTAREPDPPVLHLPPE